MARKIVWSFEAADDIEALANYISRDSAFYAAAFVQEILDVSRSLNEFSERGRVGKVKKENKAPSRGTTLGAFICGSLFIRSAPHRRSSKPAHVSLR